MRDNGRRTPSTNDSGRATGVSARGRSLLRWLFAPATEDVPRHQAVGATILRILLGLLWLWNVNWKVPPDFGTAAKSGLYQFTSYAVSNPVFPPYSYLVEHLILPNLAVFGWGVLVAETALGVLLLSGAWIRLAALLAIAQSVAITLAVAHGPNEWPWSYLMMVGGHIVLLTASSGRYLAVDAVRARLSDGRTLARVAAGVALAAGLYGVLGSFGDPLAKNGKQIGSGAWQLGLGSFNLLGGIALVIVGALLLATERAGTRAAQAALVVALLAALVMRIQAASDTRLLGGGGTSTTLLLTLALVAATRTWAHRAPADPQENP